MSDRNAISLRLQVIACRLGEGNRAMLPARAPDADGELLLSLGNVTGHDDVEQLMPALVELPMVSSRSMTSRERAASSPVRWRKSGS